MNLQKPWGRAGWLFLGACVLAGLAFRLYGLSAEGFADDEIHKWLAANRYLHGDFGGDDLEHPMLMKALIALAALLAPGSWAPETLTRLPNAVAGALTALVVAQLGRRLFGRGEGALAAALCAVSVTFIGYQRIAKEDTLVTLLLATVAWCIAEADARDDPRWELGAAVALGALFASKYYPYFILYPLIALRRRPSFSRWAMLGALTAAVFLALNWEVLLPSTWTYLREYAAGHRTETPTIFAMGGVYTNVPFELRTGVPPWYYAIFAAAKLTPPLFWASAAGLVFVLRYHDRRARPLLAWLLIWCAAFVIMGAKYGRYFMSAMPPLFLLASHAVVSAGRALRLRNAVLAGVASLFVVPEAWATLRHAPHPRLYVSSLVGGDARVGWLFPHCDFFDAGLREAVEAVARDAPSGAVVQTAVPLPVQFYAERAGRSDLRIEPLRSETLCESCFTIVQPGRVYAENRDAIARLSHAPPWRVIRVGDAVGATIYAGTVTASAP